MSFEDPKNNDEGQETESRWTGDRLFENLTAEDRPKTKEAAEHMANDHDANLDHLKYVVDPEVGETLYKLIGEHIEGTEENDKDKKKKASKTFASILDREFSRAMDEGRVQL